MSGRSAYRCSVRLAYSSSLRFARLHFPAERYDDLLTLAFDVYKCNAILRDSNIRPITATLKCQERPITTLLITQLIGATENAGVENAIRAKLQEWKMQEWKKRE